MTGRRVCLRCGATYHVEANPPAVKDVCDICGDKLVIRSDDQAEVVRHRLETYHEQRLSRSRATMKPRASSRASMVHRASPHTEKFAVARRWVCNMIHIKTEKRA